MEESNGADSWHQLIVIGNGFDLKCGLHSQYSDFFETRTEKISKLKSAWRASIENHSNSGYFGKNKVVDGIDATIWDVILSPYSEEGWCDIESAISDAVVSPPIEGTPGVASVSSLAEQVYVFLEGCRRESEVTAERENQLRMVSMADPHNMNVSAARYCMQSEGVDHFTSVDAVYDFFLREIHRLETAFSVYLQREVECRKDYQDNARSLIHSLYAKELPEELEGDEGASTSVLSFNYTCPIVAPVDLGNVQWTNIHGQLDEGNGIIFGIDGTGHMSDRHILPFTKTYRLLLRNGPDQDVVIHTKKTGEPDTSTRLIKFYGHSLAEADYSYFQALFDGVDLYESHTRLVFYYSQYGDLSALDARKEMSDRVTRLISEYATKAHKDNLMHKLLLEGRLSVEEYEREPELSTRHTR